ncbi:ImmA/IrrE family metallo-endopeptidase [Stenotrophomonas oahuensis]|uniref:ImmA/IrrE family metallo-endopeptidase n=1 Tax=Stenotrophomonas oahuensis TaxID=3003271 RepID=A0ABY9YNN4_9GAMM|nr:ImmA/IrrE family metallo-endopeptidase [Stenotrophomonas sp. A5586]WNH52055.1 ImmA/IrrE family metallo-endopeptidase [Stenotrophomonas sp. A5586]
MDELWVRQKARGFVAKVALPPVFGDLTPYLEAINAKLRQEELEQGESGYTITKPNGRHIVTVNSTETLERQRFTICHEIAHILLELPSSHEEVPSWSYAKRHPNEVACDTFASELLMPYKLWLDKVPPDDPSMEIIENLAVTFGTSFPAAASRYASLSHRPCAFVTMERGAVRYASRSTSLRNVNAQIPARSIIPAGSVAKRLREAVVSAAAAGEVAQDIWFDNWKKGGVLWEISRHFSSRDTTVSLLWFDEDELPDGELDRFGTSIDEEDGLEELTGHLSWNKQKR